MADASLALTTALARLRTPYVVESALAVGREARALLQQSTIMHHDLGVVLPADLPHLQELVVVLHGLFATAGALRPLRRRIERDTGIATATFTYEPGCNVATLSARLAALLDRVSPTCRVRLVGHSLGGIVARYYVQVSARDPRIVQTISLASPFAGTAVARWVPDFFCHDVTPNSVVLSRIERAWRRGSSVPHTSFVATHDQLVVPARSAAYPHGEVLTFPARGHNTLLFDDEVASALTRCIQHPPSASMADGSDEDHAHPHASALLMAG